jgi:hypothetical protein
MPVAVAYSRCLPQRSIIKNGRSEFNPSLVAYGWPRLRVMGEVSISHNAVAGFRQEPGMGGTPAIETSHTRKNKKAIVAYSRLSEGSLTLCYYNWIIVNWELYYLRVYKTPSPTHTVCVQCHTVRCPICDYRFLLSSALTSILSCLWATRNIMHDMPRP